MCLGSRNNIFFQFLCLLLQLTRLEDMAKRRTLLKELVNQLYLYHSVLFNYTILICTLTDKSLCVAVIQNVVEDEKQSNTIRKVSLKSTSMGSEPNGRRETRTHVASFLCKEHKIGILQYCIDKRDDAS